MAAYSIHHAQCLCVYIAVNSNGLNSMCFLNMIRLNQIAWQHRQIECSDCSDRSDCNDCSDYSDATAAATAPTAAIAAIAANAATAATGQTTR